MLDVGVPLVDSFPWLGDVSHVLPKRVVGGSRA